MSDSRILFPTIEIARQNTPFFITEEGLGIWLSTDKPALLDAFPTRIVNRDAIHLPSLDRHGQPLPEHLLKMFIARARQIGLSNVHAARGYWTLSENRFLLDEAVQIAFSQTPISTDDLLALARFVLETGNQDAVAYEINGVVHHLYS